VEPLGELENAGCAEGIVECFHFGEHFRIYFGDCFRLGGRADEDHEAGHFGEVGGSCELDVRIFR